MSRYGEAQRAHVFRRRAKPPAGLSCRACQRKAAHLSVSGFCVHCSAKMNGADAAALRGAYNDAKREIRKQGGRFWE
jgi:ribosomal protein L37AE/L43A